MDESYGGTVCVEAQVEAVEQTCWQDQTVPPRPRALARYPLECPVRGNKIKTNTKVSEC